MPGITLAACSTKCQARHGESHRPAARRSVYCLSARGKPRRNCGKCPTARLAIMQMPRRAVCMLPCCGLPVRAADSHGELCTAHAVLQPCMGGVSQRRERIARSRACHHRLPSYYLLGMAHLFIFQQSLSDKVFRTTKITPNIDAFRTLL